MVKAAVRTLTLNVYGIPLPALHAFVTTLPSSAYFDQLGRLLTARCLDLDRILGSWDGVDAQGPAEVEACLADVEDGLSYCNDVLCGGERGRALGF